MSHLENLIAEYYDWKGYLVKQNIKVGKLSHGGWEMELDVIAFDPHADHLVHIEPSIDSDSWFTREERFIKKFKAARKYIFTEIFTWLESSMEIEQMAVLITHPKGRDELAGGKIVSIDELMADIRQKVVECGIVAKNAIPEQYPLLRTLQLSHNGYYKML
ncbi:hypothetical protein [Halomonas heilongjiangensis]|uniref:NERD domain-containing protein n=1 Tax=Halomonas heilongjiangensis TaxID=1387883 RepID=A0A2N7TU57_9GAMM|nr:hypothetical protein [Halomonas heilongjiangensis]PMR71717.1 hypothetical protein C1H66_01380 [Halomonas heilongjiangensis]PXX90003.1 hypothetical protein CR158_10505 [Halomonas heilongjiangensis]